MIEASHTRDARRTLLRRTRSQAGLPCSARVRVGATIISVGLAPAATAAEVVAIDHFLADLLASTCTYPATRAQVQVPNTMTAPHGTQRRSFRRGPHVP